MTGIEELLRQSRPSVSALTSHREALAGRLREQIMRSADAPSDIWSVQRSLAILAFSAVLLVVCAGFSFVHNPAQVRKSDTKILSRELSSVPHQRNSASRPVNFQLCLLHCSYAQIARVISESAQALREIERNGRL